MYDMKRLVFATILAVFHGFASADESNAPTGVERFQLWNKCRPVHLLIELPGVEVSEIGIAPEQIEDMIRSRLGAARIYSSGHDFAGEEALLYVNVSVLRPAFATSFQLLKTVVDGATSSSSLAATWRDLAVGTHRQDSGGASFIIQHISEKTDKFIYEYLRVNADAC